MIKKIVWVLNILSAAGLVLSLLASRVSPVTFWWIAFFGLGFAILFVINFIFMSYWLAVKSKRVYLSMLLLIIGSTKIPGIIQINFDNKKEADLKKEGFIKVMSFNVRLFDLYNWFHSKETRENIFAFLEKEKPDVICFQEFYSSDKRDPNFNNEDTLRHILSAPYSQINYTYTQRKTEHWGMATYSRYPIVRKHTLKYEDKGVNTVLISDIKVGDDTLRIFNTHLESIRFAWSDYKFIENLNNEDIDQDELKGGMTILRRLKRAFLKRARQVEKLKDTIVASPYPVILCGDFNDTPASYTYKIISENMKDAFRESGHGSGKTYAGPFPSFRIDYIFHDKRITSHAYQTEKEKLSDHYPISCFVKVLGK